MYNKYKQKNIIIRSPKEKGIHPNKILKKELM
jgi:hypothetical protein